VALSLLQPPAIRQPRELSAGASGSLRTCVESWDWFQGNANNDYTFPGSIFRLSLSQATKVYDWQLEFALLGLPNDAIASGTQGQLGLGASYFAGNSNNMNAALPFVKQGFMRFKALGGIEGQSLKIGRTEFMIELALALLAGSQRCAQGAPC
jgi:hypothetical protein